MKKQAKVPTEQSNPVMRFLHSIYKPILGLALKHRLVTIGIGYNFSVAVWVGFIALFGTAVQTGVVMVIYLNEAVENKHQELGRKLTRSELMKAVTEGALLRLRPKVMTVSTVVAGLLPIMWSSSVGSEVMKPLAAPVLGGMVSSLLHVLIVTLVIFYWLRERELKKVENEEK